MPAAAGEVAPQHHQEGVARGVVPSLPWSRGVGVVSGGRGWDVRRTLSLLPLRRTLLTSGAVGALWSELGSGGSLSG